MPIGCSRRSEYQLSVTFTSCPSSAGRDGHPGTGAAPGQTRPADGTATVAVRRVAALVVCQPGRTPAPTGGDPRGPRGRGTNVLPRRPAALPREAAALAGRLRPDAQRVEVRLRAPPDRDGDRVQPGRRPAGPGDAQRGGARRNRRRGLPG